MKESKMVKFLNSVSDLKDLQITYSESDSFISADSDCLSYIRDKCSYLFDLRVRDKLKMKPSISSQCYESFDSLLRFYILSLLRDDKNKKNRSPLVKYCERIGFKGV